MKYWNDFFHGILNCIEDNYLLDDINYHDFNQVEDEDVLAMLKRTKKLGLFIEKSPSFSFGSPV
jgi:hypothetical protein